MERSKSKSNYYSRRAVIATCVGGVATELMRESVKTAPDPETMYGGEWCVSAPDTEGIDTLETIHEEASDTSEAVDHYEVAELYGMKLVPREELTRFVREELMSARTSQEAITIFNNFTTEWFEIDASLDLTSIGENTRHVLDDPAQMISILSFLLRNMAYLPAEFYKKIKFSHIEIADLPDGIAGDYTVSLERIRLDPTHVASSDTYFHEVGHAVHMTGCPIGDEAITDTLPEGVEYTGEVINEPIEEDIFAEPYGQKNYLEDVATIVEGWITGRIGLSEDERGTPQYKKLAIMMDRFDTLLPGIVRYIEEGVRPQFQSDRRGA